MEGGGRVHPPAPTVPHLTLTHKMTKSSDLTGMFKRKSNGI